MLLWLEMWSAALERGAVPYYDRKEEYLIHELREDLETMSVEDFVSEAGTGV